MARGFLRLLATVGVAALVAACGASGSDVPYHVTSRTVSDATTQDILLFSPDATGSWPMVLALHGKDGTAGDMAPLAERVAAAGSVVFAPNYRTDVNTQQGVVDLANDVECGYRYARTIAPEHGGDLHRPVVWMGWSLGAVIALQGGLDESIDPTGMYITCPPEPPRPDVIVAVSGCYGDVGTIFDPGQWANQDARIVVVAGKNDTVCPASQSERLVEELKSRGYDVRLVLLAGADHRAPVEPDGPAGKQVLRILTGALDAPAS